MPDAAVRASAMANMCTTGNPTSRSLRLQSLGELEFQMVSPPKIKLVGWGLFLEQEVSPGFDMPSTAEYFCEEQCIISTPEGEEGDVDPPGSAKFRA